MRCRTSINLGTIQGEQHEGAPLALTCALGTTLVSATPALAVEPVVVVATERPEFGPAASTTYLAWIVLRYGQFTHENVRARAIGSDTPGAW